jgi:hypothetical protein
VLWLGVTLAGCSSVYYAVVEQLGWEKRDVLLSRVEAVRASQREAMTRFLDALGQLHDVVESDAAGLPKQFEEFRTAYAYATKHAADVRKRIAAVESAGTALFSEWRAEAAATKDAASRARLQQTCDASQVRYDRLLAALHDAAAAMPPVLDAMQTQLTYLTGHLTPPGVSAMQPSVVSTAALVDGLIRDFEQSMAEADAFIRDIGLN